MFKNPRIFDQNDKSIKDLIKKLDRYKDTFAQVKPSVIGVYAHALEELATLESFILGKKFDVLHEEKVDQYGHRPDLSIQVDKDFRTQFAAIIKKKYNLDITKMDTVNFDFSNSYDKRKLNFISDKFFKGYQSEKSASFIILTHHKLYDKTHAKDFIAKFDPIIASMDLVLYPEHIRIITLDEFISTFGIEGRPLQDLQYYRQLKDQALSHIPDVSNDAFEILSQLYIKAKLTLDLIKTDPANVARILQTRQLDLTKFLGDPNKKIDDFL